jgi:hypothetical protein
VQGPRGLHILVSVPFAIKKTRTQAVESSSVISGNERNTMHIDYFLYKIEVDGKFGMVITTIGIKIIIRIAI